MEFIEDIVFSGRRRPLHAPDAQTAAAASLQQAATSCDQLPDLAQGGPLPAAPARGAPLNLEYEYDHDADSDCILDRVDGLLHGMLDSLQAEELPALQESADGSWASQQHLQGRTRPTEYSMSISNARSTGKLLRAVVVLDVVQNLQTEGETQTQRDIYYSVKSDDLFPSAQSVYTGASPCWHVHCAG